LQRSQIISIVESEGYVNKVHRPRAGPSRMDAFSPMERGEFPEPGNAPFTEGRGSEQQSAFSDGMGALSDSKIETFEKRSLLPNLGVRLKF